MKKQKFYRNNQIEHCDAVLITADKLLAVGHSALRAYGDEYNFGYDEEFKAEFITQIYNLKEYCDCNGIENGYPRFSAVIQHVQAELSKKYDTDSVEWLFDNSPLS